MCCLHNLQSLAFSRGCPDKFDLYGRVADLEQQGRRVHECLRVRPRVCPQKVTRSAQGSPQSLLGKICLDEQVRKTHTSPQTHTVCASPTQLSGGEKTPQSTLAQNVTGY